MKRTLLAITVVGLLAVTTADAFSQGKNQGANSNGNGIGAKVSQAAKSGVRGQELAEYVARLNAARGVGQKESPSPSDKKGGRVEVDTKPKGASSSKAGKKGGPMEANSRSKNAASAKAAKRGNDRRK